MQRLLSAFASFAFALTLGTAVSADSMATAKPAMMATSKPAMSKMMPMAKTPKCAKGTTLVKGYTKKDGTKVAAYCRKSKM